MYRRPQRIPTWLTVDGTIVTFSLIIIAASAWATGDSARAVDSFWLDGRALSESLLQLGALIPNRYCFKIFAVENLPTRFKGNPHALLQARRTTPRDPDAINLHKHFFTLANYLDVPLLKPSSHCETLVC
jgi:hypothetical protein